MSFPIQNIDEHAHRVLKALRDDADEASSNVIVHSWRRCFNDYKLHPARLPKPPQLGTDELRATA